MNATTTKSTSFSLSLDVSRPGALTSTSTYVVRCSGYCIAVKIPRAHSSLTMLNSEIWLRLQLWPWLWLRLRLRLRRMTPDDSGIKIKPHDIRRQEATRACANARPRAGAAAGAASEGEGGEGGGWAAGVNVASPAAVSGVIVIVITIWPQRSPELLWGPNLVKRAKF